MCFAESSSIHFSTETSLMLFRFTDGKCNFSHNWLISCKGKSYRPTQFSRRKSPAWRDLFFHSLLSFHYIPQILSVFWIVFTTLSIPFEESRVTPTFSQTRTKSWIPSERPEEGSMKVSIIPKGFHRFWFIHLSANFVCKSMSFIIFVNRSCPTITAARIFPHWKDLQISIWWGWKSLVGGFQILWAKNY